MKIKLDRGRTLNTDLLGKILRLHKTDEARKKRLADYYVGKQDILKRQMADHTKPNNKSINSYGNYITNTFVGYFMGQAVKYQATEDKYAALVEEMKLLFLYNDEQQENIRLAKDASKFGVAYELMYIDEDGNVRFKSIDPICGVPIYSNDLEEELIYFLRYYSDDLEEESSYTLEVISASETSYYRVDNETFNFMGSEPHYFKMVPVAVYSNNEEELGDYEIVMSLIDNYDKMSSDSINDFEQFADAYLVLENMGGTSSEDIVSMKEERVLLLPENGKANWLIKSINDTYFQNTLDNLDKNIHKFSNVPNMEDEAFGNNLSGIAIKYKLIGLENKAAIKESYFKQGLQRRIELMTAILSMFDDEFTYLGMDIVFSRNLPVNEVEAVAMANQLVGLVSDETAISQLPFVADAAKELEKRNSSLDFDFPLISDEQDEQETT